MSAPLDLRTSSPLRTIQVVAWAATLVMVAAIAFGVATADEGAVSELLANVWARVTILDLYIALGAIGAWIAWRERSVLRTLAWLVGLVVTGSVAAGLYVALAAGRARTMTELLCGPQDISFD